MKKEKQRCECGAKVYVAFSKRSNGRGRTGGTERWKDHNLCLRCYRALNDRTAALRKGPKPMWVAARPIARIMAQAAGG